MDQDNRQPRMAIETDEDVPTPTEKRCVECSRDKPIEDYPPNARSRDKLSRICEECLAKKVRKTPSAIKIENWQDMVAHTKPCADHRWYAAPDEMIKSRFPGFFDERSHHASHFGWYWRVCQHCGVAEHIKQADPSQQQFVVGIPPRGPIPVLPATMPIPAAMAKSLNEGLAEFGMHLAEGEPDSMFYVAKGDVAAGVGVSVQWQETAKDDGDPGDEDDFVEPDLPLRMDPSAHSLWAYSESGYLQDDSAYPSRPDRSRYWRNDPNTVAPVPQQGIEDPTQAEHYEEEHPTPAEVADLQKELGEAWKHISILTRSVERLKAQLRVRDIDDQIARMQTERSELSFLYQFVIGEKQTTLAERMSLAREFQARRFMQHARSGHGS